MTVSPHAPPLVFADLAAAVGALRDRGLRVTTPRRSVLDALFAADGPVSAEHIARRSRLDVASVYRNLETLEHHGLAQHVHLGHGPGLYVLVGRGEREFLACERCGAVRTATPEQLDPVRARVKELFGYEVRFTHFAIVGLCAGCARQRQPIASRQSTRPRGGLMTDENNEHLDVHEHLHQREHPHSHEHEHDGTVHEHVHTEHEHDHVEHEHEHSHGDHVHSHPHAHQEGLEAHHEHGH